MNPALAIAAVQARMLVNSVRRERRGWNVLSGVLLALTAILFSAGLALGMGALTYAGALDAESDKLRIAFLATFWISSIFGLLMPILLSTGGCGLDTSNLRQFPISRRRLFSITWGSAFVSTDHLFHYPALLAAFAAGVVFPGHALASGALFFLLMVVVIVSWTQAVIHMMQGILRHRRLKEFLGLVIFGVIVSISLLPAALQGFDAEREAGQAYAAEGFFESVAAVFDYAPPNLAANGLAAALAGEGGLALSRGLGLLAWALLGVVAAYFAFLRFALRETESTRSNRGALTRGRFADFDITESLPWIPKEVLGAASKELRYLLRSLIGRFNIGMITLFVAVVAFVFAPMMTEPVMGIDPMEISFYGLLMYTVLFLNNLAFNSLGWEGVGFQVYLLSPAPIRSVILGKNLGLWTYCLILNTICVVGWIALTGFPGFGVLANAVLISFCVNVLFVSVGNFASFAFPVARSVASMKSNPSQTAILISMGTLFLLACAFGAVMIAPLALGVPELQPLFMLAMAVASVALYRVSLRFASQLFVNRQERSAAILEGDN